jgi:hypothetical protein
MFLGLLALLLIASSALAYRAFGYGLGLRSEGLYWGAAAFLLCAAAAAVLATFLVWWLFCRVPEPDGVPLERDSVESLFRAIDRVARHLGGVQIDRIHITGDMNAAIMQRPRWGFVGPMQTFLQLGLPLVHSVSSRQLRAVLAHECGHLVLQRKGLQAWGYHMRAWAFRVMERLVDGLPFLPRAVHRQFNAFTVTAARLSRLEEFEADWAAAQIVGSPLVAETLVEVSLRERFLSDDFMCRVMAQCGSLRAPAMRPYREMGADMAAGFRWPAADDGQLGVRSLTGSAVAEPGQHPPLSSRLAALGVRRVRPGRRAGSAAEEHLAHILPELASTFDRAWWREVRRFWRTHYRGSRRSGAIPAEAHGGDVQKAARSASR